MGQEAAKVYGNFVLTKAPKREKRDITGEKPAIESIKDVRKGQEDRP